jgi:ATP-dependent DNA helicase DinG
LVDLEKIFGKDGLLAQGHGDYEYREGQVRMAEAVTNALENGRHLVVEAGTGTGKTLAYLIPAIAHAIAKKQRVIISTGTKALQEQLMEKDIPFLQKVLPKKFVAAYMKGRSNYACIYRIRKAEDQPILDGLDEVGYFDEIRGWVRQSKTGDRAELKNLPENLPFWSRINAKSDTCLGQKCPDYEQCFITRMRDKAETADIVIVNHHLFFADLSVRGNQYGRVLPEYGAVIFDEAHLIEDIASEYFGVELSNFRLEEIVRDTESLPIKDAVSMKALQKVALRMGGLAEQFWLAFPGRRNVDGRVPISPAEFAREIRDGEVQLTNLGDAANGLDSALKRLEDAIGHHSAEVTEAESLAKRVRQARNDLDFLTMQRDSNYVFWYERRGKGSFLKSSPIDVSSILGTRLFSNEQPAVLASATISSKGSFDFIIDRLGIDRNLTDTLLAPSAFDYRKQAVLYIPKAMPDPKAAEFNQIAAGEIIKLLEISKGRAFVLCTSNFGMKALHELVSARTGYPCMVQGSASKAGLLEWFRETPNAVLFATSSFWQGVDVRGEQLSCVIIDKLPFAVPSDPVVAARSRFLDESGGNSFFDYSVPQAVITLKQGIGRLIRSKTDSGIVAILDSRLRTKGYGKDFLKSFPEMEVVDDLRIVAEFFGDKP